MCLGAPAKVMEINYGDSTAMVDFFGVSRRVGISLVPGIEVNDYVLVHAGYALEKIDTREAEERIKLWQELLAEDEG